MPLKIFEVNTLDPVWSEDQLSLKGKIAINECQGTVDHGFALSQTPGCDFTPIIQETPTDSSTSNGVIVFHLGKLSIVQSKSVTHKMDSKTLLPNTAYYVKFWIRLFDKSVVFGKELLIETPPSPARDQLLQALQQQMLFKTIQDDLTKFQAFQKSQLQKLTQALAQQKEDLGQKLDENAKALEDQLKAVDTKLEENAKASAQQKKDLEQKLDENKKASEDQLKAVNTKLGQVKKELKSFEETYREQAVKEELKEFSNLKNTVKGIFKNHNKIQDIAHGQNLDQFVASYTNLLRKALGQFYNDEAYWEEKKKDLKNILSSKLDKQDLKKIDQIIDQIRKEF